MDRDDFRTTTNVSRETIERLDAYADLLRRWQPRINLVGPDTVPDLWRRHFLDSAQLLGLVAPLVAKRSTFRLADLGSGAGFPGLVLAILGVPGVILVESDARKAAFLREVARVTGTTVEVRVARAERLVCLGADVITARALAPLAELLALAEPHLAPGGHCLFLKGKSCEDELTAAGKEWNITVARTISVSDPSGVILHLSEVSRGQRDG